MAEPITDFAKLSPERQEALAKNYADRLLYALTEEGQLGKGRGTLEEEVERLAKELQKIGSSDFVNLIDGEIRKKNYKGLRKILIEDYSLDDEDAILNAFGYPTDDVIGTSLQESQASNPSKSDFSKFGPGGAVQSNEFSPDEAVVADEGVGSGKIDVRDQERFLEPGAVDIAKPNEDAEPELNLDEPAPAEAEGNPYLFGTEGNQSQIANLSDIGNGKVAMPNRSDRRSMAQFNNDVKSKEFALNAAQRKARELKSLEKGRRDRVSLTEPAMKQWIKANPKSRAAKLALDADGNVDLSKISDAEKIQFTKNLNLGNIDFFNKPEASVNKGVPIFDEDGLVGFEDTKKFEEDMGGQKIRMNPEQPNSIQKRERKDMAMLDDIRGEIKETGKHPFGEGPILGTDFAREVELRDQFDGGDIGGLKKAARDFRDHAARDVRDNTKGIDIPSPMPAKYSASKETFEPSQKMVSQDMLDRNNQEVNSVLDSVPFSRPKSPAAPRTKPRNPVTTLPFSLEQPVSKEPGVELTRTSKEYSTMDAPAAQNRKQTPGFGRSGKKQYNIPQLDRLDMDNYDYRPNAPKHPGGAGMGRSGKKQYPIPALDFLDLDNYFYNQ